MNTSTTENSKQAAGSRRRLEGVVASARMQKTVAVRIDRLVMHPKYRKQYRVSARYLVHNEIDGLKEGDRVTIEETRPLSARKRWRVVSKV